MTGKDQLSLAAVVAVLASGISLAPLTRDRTYLMLAAVLLLASAGLGAMARRFVRSEVVVRLVQLIPIVLLPWLVPEAQNPRKLAADTYAYIQQGSAPMPFHVGFAVFCVLLIWISYLVVESLVNARDAPGWTFVPLVTPFLISATFGYFEANPWLFVLTAGGFGLLLATAARSRVAVRPDASGREELATLSWRTGISRAAMVSTIGAIAVSMLVGFALPASFRLSSSTAGPGEVRFNDPSLDLIRNLNSTSNLPVITYRSTADGGVMLRLAALPILDDTGFHPGSPDLVAMPLPPAGGSEPATVTTDVTVKDFASGYLPAPWIPTSTNVTARDWKWDQATLAVVAVGSSPDTATRNLIYSVTSSEVPTLDWFARTDALPGTEGPDVTLQVPAGVDPRATDLVRRLTSGKDGAFRKALALRDYLRSDLFTYSTQTAPGTTLQTLNDFLFGSRTGYCEQFAGAMAVLARIARIPSRVVVGFRPGTKTGDTWEVTPRDMHAWAELYFDGVGWIPVDATPPSVFGSQPTASPSASPSATHTSAAPTESASAAPTQQAPVTPDVDDDGPNPLGVGALVVLGLAVVAFAPNLVRRLLRLLRVSGHGRQPHEDAWDEVWATARDQGVRWPRGSTRAVAAALAPELDGSARGQFVALALSTERERYAPQREPVGAVSGQVATIRKGIQERWPGAPTWLDRWWPRSLWPRSR